MEILNKIPPVAGTLMVLYHGHYTFEGIHPTDDEAPRHIIPYIRRILPGTPSKEIYKYVVEALDSCKDRLWDFEMDTEAKIAKYFKGNAIYGPDKGDNWPFLTIPIDDDLNVTNITLHLDPEKPLPLGTVNCYKAGYSDIAELGITGIIHPTPTESLILDREIIGNDNTKFIIRMEGNQCGDNIEPEEPYNPEYITVFQVPNKTGTIINKPIIQIKNIKSDEIMIEI